MTVGQFFDQAKVWFERLRPWALVIVPGVLLILLVHQCNQRRDEHDKLARLQEKDRLRDAGAIVAEPQPNLKDELGRMTSQNQELESELKKVRKEASMKPKEVIRVVTKVVTVSGPPRPCPQPLAVPGTNPSDPPKQHAAGSPSSTPDSASSCVLANGDQAQIRVDEVVLETRHGNKVLVGTASAWRTDPKPEGRLFGGPFDPIDAKFATVEPERKQGWGVGLWAGLERNGWTLGPSVATPPWRLFGREVEWMAAGGIGPGGTWQLGTGLLVRP